MIQGNITKLEADTMEDTTNYSFWRRLHECCYT